MTIYLQRDFAIVGRDKLWETIRRERKKKEKRRGKQQGFSVSRKACRVEFAWKEEETLLFLRFARQRKRMEKMGTWRRDTRRYSSIVLRIARALCQRFLLIYCHVCFPPLSRLVSYCPGKERYRPAFRVMKQLDAIGVSGRRKSVSRKISVNV